MEFRSGRTAEIARSQLKDASKTDAVHLDRLAIAVSVASGPLGVSDAGLDASDGTAHDLHALERLGGREILRPLMNALEGRDLSQAELRDRLRRHINRGFDLLYRTFEASRKDWEATLYAISPRIPEYRGPQGSEATAIDIEIGRDLDDGHSVLWPFNREGGSQTNSNIRIAGMPGVGKSQVLLNLLAGVAERSSDVGFILLDYKGDLAPNKEFLKATRARVLRPGQDRIPINPFQLPDSVNPALAPRVFAETFRVLSPRIGPVQESRLVRAMERCYVPVLEAGTDFDEADGLVPGGAQARGNPTLEDIVAAVEDVYADEGHAEDSVLATLRDLTRYNLFADRCEHPLPEVFSARWVIDLASLQTLRDFVAFVLMEFLHQVARSLPDAVFDAASDRRHIRGIVAVDEAHYYLQARCRPLLDLIRIGRSKGLPVFLSSQSLEDFRGHTEVNEFLPNTFVFRHGLPPDRRTLAGALRVGLSEAAQLASRATALEKFQALVTLPDSHTDQTELRKLTLNGFWERNNR